MSQRRKKTAGPPLHTREQVAPASTRERAVAAMARLLRHRGYAATSLQQVVAASGAPIGSLYHHFPGGKAALAAAAVTGAGTELGTRLKQLLADEDAASALRAIAAAMGQDLERSKWRGGCPIASTALERSAEDASIRRAADGVFRGWQHLFAERLVVDGFDPQLARELGVLLVSSLEGALILARSQRSTAPLEETANSLAVLLRSAAANTAKH